MKKQILFYLATITLLSACSVGNEVIMPFRNGLYSGERLFPIENNNSEIAFRAWINNGTSIDRVITVSYDSLFNYQSNIIEFGFLSKNGPLRSRNKPFFKKREITLKSGSKHFFQTIDSLNLINYLSQDSFYPLEKHQPFSIYIIEIKMGNKYNQFNFRTYFPDATMKVEDNYEIIEELIFKEFKYNFYMK